MSTCSAEIRSLKNSVGVTPRDVANSGTNNYQQRGFLVSNIVTSNGKYSAPVIKEYTNLNAEGSPEQTDNSLSVIVSNSYAVPVMNIKIGKIYMAQAGAEPELNSNNQMILKANPDYVLMVQSKKDSGSTTPPLSQFNKVDISLYKISKPEQAKGFGLSGATISSSRKDLLKGAGVSTGLKTGSKNFGALDQLMIPESTKNFSLQEGAPISFGSSSDSKNTKFTYEGITKIVKISSDTKLFGVGSQDAIFEKNLADQSIKDGNGIKVTVNDITAELIYRRRFEKNCRA